MVLFLLNKNATKEGINILQLAAVFFTLVFIYYTSTYFTPKLSVSLNLKILMIEQTNSALYQRLCYNTSVLMITVIIKEF